MEYVHICANKENKTSWVLIVESLSLIFYLLYLLGIARFFNVSTVCRSMVCILSMSTDTSLVSIKIWRSISISYAALCHLPNLEQHLQAFWLNFQMFCSAYRSPRVHHFCKAGSGRPIHQPMCWLPEALKDTVFNACTQCQGCNVTPIGLTNAPAG